MKTIIVSAALLLMTLNAFADSDRHDRVYLVVQDIMSEEFFVERAPIIGCSGSAKGAQLIQFTSEYKVNSNIGCGGETLQDNINYLTCATLVSAKELSDSTSFSEITLDISKCEAKNNSKFITMLRTAAKLNFSLKKGEVKLNLIK